MTLVRWNPGKFRALAWEKGFALLAVDVPEDAAEQVWHTVRRDPQLGVFLQVLMESTGRGLLTIPSFAVVMFAERGAQVAVRGDFRVALSQGSETLTLNGVGVTTWEEKSVPGVSAAVISASDYVDESLGLPLVSGVVSAGRLLWGDPIAEIAKEHEASSAFPAVDSQDMRAENEQQPSVAPAEKVPLSSEVPDKPVEPDLNVAVEHNAVANAVTLSPESIQDEAVAAAVEVEKGGSVPYAHLWSDESVAFDVESAAIRDGDSSVSVPQPLPSPSESHRQEEISDGLTVVDENAEAEISVVKPKAQTVLAAFCTRGHPNPPQRAQCYTCDSAVGGQPRAVERPQLGWLRISGGESVPLSGPVVAGRNPRATALPDGEEPKLIALPHRHISGNHIAFILESWTILARDLGSSNGSYLRRHGKPPVRLPEQAIPLVPGDVIDLGHGVFINLDRIP